MEQSICLKCNKNLKWEEQFISSEGDFCKDCYNEELYKNTTLLGESKLYDRREKSFDVINAKITQILSSGFIEDSRDSYEERAEALLSSEIEPGVTLGDVIEFYFKNRIDTKALSEALLPIAKKAQENQEEASKAHRRIWDIIDDCMKKAKDNATTA